jgi:protein-S-isoprenylcysteine O-methyltransferase Ste14
VTLDRNLPNFSLLGLVLPFFYAFIQVLAFMIPALTQIIQFFAFADYTVSELCGLIGVGISAFAVWLFWRSHHDLGQQWSGTLEIQKDHILVTGGIYSQIRHPMYLANILLGIAIPLLILNWIFCFYFLIASLLLYLCRVPKEEAMMLDQFGEEYQQYMNRTGGLFPLIFR